MLSNLLSKGDELAFSEVYNRFWKKIFTIAYNRLREIESAEDIVHDVFASLWANREKAGIESLENYLATAAKYMVFAKLKIKGRERAFNQQSIQTPVPEMSVENALHFKRVLELVRYEVEKLPEKC
ncbi:MAG: hypothetical protein H7Y03_05775, partial [Chitinophagaceae bacterium]|nr:hypothetical protein [Chitinophagaceae bacterium]